MGILVTGASGFLGIRLIRNLILEYEVTAISRHPMPKEFLKHSNLNWVQKDLMRDVFYLKDFPNICSIIHLAGATLGAGKDENKFLCSNEQTLVRVLQVFSEKVEKIIFASSQVVYGNACHTRVTENFPLVTPSSAYACSKINSENWLRWFSNRYSHLQSIALRLCGFIDGGGIVDYIIDKAQNNEAIELFDNGKICRDYLPSSDAINAIVSAHNVKLSAGFLPVNVGSGQIISAYKIAQIICKQIESQSVISLLPDPAPQGHFVFSIERAQKLFYFQPSNLVEAIRDYVQLRSEKRHV